MNDTQNLRGSSRVVSLNDLIWFIASRWRKLLLFALIAAMLSGGATSLSHAMKLRSSEYLAAAEEKNARQEAVYQETRDRLTALQQHLRTQMDYQGAYTASPLFQMDPYAVNTVTTVYCASVEGDGGSPAAVLAAYGARFSQVDVSSVIPSGSDQGLSRYYIQFSPGNTAGREDLTIGMAGNAADTMTVTVIGPTAEQAAAIQALVDQAADEARAEIAGNVAPHTLVKLFQTVTVSENPALVSMHSEFESRLMVAREQYDGVTAELNKLKSPSKLIVSTRGALSDAVKKAVLGGVAGLILALGYLLVYAGLRNRILNADDLMGNLSADYLGSLNADPGRGRLDSFIVRQMGMLPGKTREQELDLIASNLTRDGAPASSAALVGGAEPEVIRALARDLTPLVGELKLVPGGDLLTSAEALRAYRDCEAVIFVETVGRSGRSSVARTGAMAAADGKKVLGAILTGEPHRSRKA